jgi:hypothetical protein
MNLLIGSSSKYILAKVLTNTANIPNPDQLIFIGKQNCEFSIIQNALDSIEDAASDKIYTAIVFPGKYEETITLKNYFNIIMIDPFSTEIAGEVEDNNEAIHSILQVTINSPSGHGLNIQNTNSVIKVYGDIISNYDSVINNNGNLTINGNIICYYNNANGHGIEITGGTLKLNNGKIFCTHLNANSIYAGSSKDVYSTNMWGNRNDHANITQKILGGFHYDQNLII